MSPVSSDGLAFEFHAGTTDPVLAIHGVSETRRVWNWVRTAAPSLTLVTPDLRGRGGSVDLPGPTSLRRHTDDLVALLDDLGLQSVVVAGGAFGAVVAVALATAHPERVRGLVLVDGGFPATTRGAERTPWDPVGHDTGPAGYALAFAAAHPGLDLGDPLLIDYLAHEVRGDRVLLDAAVVRADAAEAARRGHAWESLTVPTWLLHTEGTAGTPAVYAPADVERFTTALAGVLRTQVLAGGGTPALMTRPGAQQVAGVLRATLTGYEAA